MTVDEEKAAATSEYKGKKYYLCAIGCKKAFGPRLGGNVHQLSHFATFDDYAINKSNIIYRAR